MLMVQAYDGLHDLEIFGTIGLCLIRLDCGIVGVN